MRRAERLDAPRVWLPRGGRRGWLRATAVATLVAAAAAIVLFNHDPDAGRHALSGQGTVGRAPASSRAPGGNLEGASPAGSDRSRSGRPAAGGTASEELSDSGECRPGGAAPSSGTVGFPLRLADPAVLAVVRAGQRVDVLVRTDANAATVLAADVPVLCGAGAPTEPDGVLYLAVSPAQARALAAIGSGARISVTVRSPG